MDKESIREIAEMAAKTTVNEMFLNFGINIADPNEIPKFQRDLAHLRGWRESTESLKQNGLKAAVSFLVTAALGWALYWISQWHGH